MDTFEIMTALRNITRLHSQEQLSDAELLRNVNLAYQMTCALLYPLFKEDLVVTLQETVSSGDYAIPKDALLLINVYRRNAATVFKLCTKLEMEKAGLIGTVNYPSDEDYPIVVQLGSLLSFTPALSATTIKLEYRKRIPELLFGIGTSASDGSYLTLNSYGPVRDDVLNYSWMALYKLTSGVPYLVTVAKIGDYAGSTKRATMTCPDNSQSYYYALVPMLPDEFHNFIVELSLVYLALAGYYAKDSELLKKGVMQSIIFVLQSQGVEYSSKMEAK
jgi:hypothetical protein